MATGTAPIDYTPDVLLNEGVPVQMFDEGGKPETVRLKFTWATLAGLDKAFHGYTVTDSERGSHVERDLVLKKGGGTREKKVTHETRDDITRRRVLYGQEALQAASVLEPAITILKVFAVVFIGNASDESMAAIAGRMVPTEQTSYTAAVNAAIQLAQGADPTLAAEALATGQAFVAAQQEQASRIMVEMSSQAREMTESILSPEVEDDPEEEPSPGSSSTTNS